MRFPCILYSFSGFKDSEGIVRANYIVCFSEVSKKKGLPQLLTSLFELKKRVLSDNRQHSLIHQAVILQQLDHIDAMAEASDLNIGVVEALVNTFHSGGINLAAFHAVNFDAHCRTSVEEEVDGHLI